MDLLPQGFHLDATTWFYLSLLLIVAVYFRFHRIWSLRNVDVCLLLCASPGLMLVQSGRVKWGFTLLFSVTGLFLLRLVLDPLFKRRPHTTQNLNSAGLAFLCASAFVLLSMQLVSEQLPESTQQTMQMADNIIHRTARPDVALASIDPAADVEPGPTTPMIAASFEVMFQHLAPRVMAMAAHLAVIIGLLFVGRNLFGDIQLGTAMATLYMLIPCTAYEVGAFNHVLPSALIVWAIVAYKRPVMSGTLMGLACGTLVFPLFLVPLWVAFYGRRGGGRFVLALTIVFLALLGTHAFTSTDPDSFWKQTMGTIRLPVLALIGRDEAVSFWGDLNSPYRIPVVAAYFVMLIVLTIWPRHKTLENLMASSAALVVGVQFWYPQQGGVYLLWYLPLLLMVIFRPRIAQLAQQVEVQTIADVKTAPAMDATRPPSRSGTMNRSTLFR